MEEYRKTRKEDVEPGEVGITIKEGAFGWGFRVKEVQEGKKAFKTELEKVEEPTISKLNFDLKYNSLLMVVGKIGSGKTTLLHSIMEENVKMSGEASIRGKIAYVEQEPFIFSGTIEENITFGYVFDEERFNKCIEAACLQSDMKLFAQGRQTIIGDRGINVSGGQKARIGLARAIY